MSGAEREPDRPMVAAMATLSGSATGLAEIARIAGGAIEGWLRDYDGYRGLVILTDEEGQRAHVVTLWNTLEDEEATRGSRIALRDQIAAQAGLTVDTFDVFEVPVCELVLRGDAIVR